MASRQILGQLLVLFFILFSQRVTVFCDEEDDTEPEGTSNPILNESEKEKEIVVKSGERVEIECTIQDKGGLPLIWRKEDKVIAMSSFITNDEDKKYYSIDGDKLIILQVDKSLLGTYVCSATDDVYQNHHISFPSAPTTVKIWPPNLTFKKKNKVELECESDGAPKPSIEWKINNEKLPSGMKAHGNKLVISSASEKYDGAEITCIAKNEFGSAKDTNKLNVKYGPILTDPKTENIQVAVGKNTSFSCEHIANPHAKIIWHFNGTKVEGKDNKVTLDLKNVKPSEEGLYECHLTNELENVIKKFHLKILYPPQITTSSNWVHTGEGRTSDIACTMIVKRPAEVYWLHNNSKILHSSNKIMAKQGNKYSLQIKQLKLDDFGNYSCCANDSIGHNCKIITLSGLASPVQIEISKLKNRVAKIIYSSWSYTPILMFELLYRNVSQDKDVIENKWINITIPAEQSDFLYHNNYLLDDIDPIIAYEFVMRAQNTYGWNHPSKAITAQANEAHSTMNYQQTDEGSSVGGHAAISVKEEEEQDSSNDKPNSSSLLRSSSLLPLFIIFLIISIL